jgi:hypothetical protein
MVTRSNVKMGLTGAVLLIIIGSFSACAELPTASTPDRDSSDRCVRIDNIIHCPPT